MNVIFNENKKAIILYYVYIIYNIQIYYLNIQYLH